METVKCTVKKGTHVEDTKDGAGHEARSDTSRQTMMNMQTARKAEDNLNQKTMEKSEECRSSGMWRSQRRKRRLAIVTHTMRWNKAQAALGADPSSGQARM